MEKACEALGYMKELADNGLRHAALVPIGQGLYPMPSEYRNEPMTWTVAAERIPE